VHNFNGEICLGVSLQLYHLYCHLGYAVDDTFVPLRRPRDRYTQRTWRSLGSPFVLLDWAVVEFLFGLMLWYADKSDRWRYSLVAAGLSILLAITPISIAVWMWQDMSRSGRLGGAEKRPKVCRYNTGGQSRKHSEAYVDVLNIRIT
jgi:hypothetical protein